MLPFRFRPYCATFTLSFIVNQQRQSPSKDVQFAIIQYNEKLTADRNCFPFCPLPRPCFIVSCFIKITRKTAGWILPKLFVRWRNGQMNNPLQTQLKLHINKLQFMWTLRFYTYLCCHSHVGSSSRQFFWYSCTLSNMLTLTVALLTH